MASRFNYSISKTEYTCDGCGKFLSYDGTVPYRSRGNHYCSLGCKRNIEGTNQSNSNSSSNNNNNTGNRMSREERALNEAQRRNLDAQTQYLNEQAESEKKRRKQLRADELRKQGKTFQAFMVEHSLWEWVGIAAFFLACFIYIKISKSH